MIDDEKIAATIRRKTWFATVLTVAASVECVVEGLVFGRWFTAFSFAPMLAAAIILGQADWLCGYLRGVYGLDPYKEKEKNARFVS